MKLKYIVFLFFSLISLSAGAQSIMIDDDISDKELQIERCLQQMDVDYSTKYDAQQFGLPAPDSLNLRNQYGNEVIAYEICPAIPVGIVICISGRDAPSASAYYGHAMEFYKLGYATFTMDVSNHSKTDDSKRYEEIKDVQAVIDYIKTKTDYINLPIVVMGVAMGGTVAIRSMIESYDINAAISLSAYSSFEDYFAFNHNEADPKYDFPNVSLKDIEDMSAADSITLSKLCCVKGIDQRPILLMQSKKDKIVPYAYFTRLSKEMRKYTNELVSFVVEGDEHYICRDFINPSSDKAYFETLTDFLKRITPSVPLSAYRKLEDTQEI